MYPDFSTGEYSLKDIEEFGIDVKNMSQEEIMEMIKTDATNNPDSQEVLKIFNTALERIVN